MVVIAVFALLIPVFFFQNLLRQFEDRLSRLQDRLGKAKRVEGLFDKVLAWIKGTESLGLDDEVAADVNVIEECLGQLVVSREYS